MLCLRRGEGKVRDCYGLVGDCVLSKEVMEYRMPDGKACTISSSSQNILRE